MKLSEIDLSSGRPVDGYGPQFFRIAGEVRRGHQLILPTGVFDWGGYDDQDRIVQAAGSLDVLLVGTGREMAPIPNAFKTRLAEAIIGIEPMATPTACRTYNVLLGEGRRVAAALLIVGT